MSRVKTELRHFDWMIAGILAVLVLLSLVGLWSASHQPGADAPDGPQYHLRQLKWLALSGLVCLAVCLPHYTLYSRFAFSGYIVFIAMLIMVRFVGVTRFGARRWLDFRFMDFQPSEMMKVVIVLTLARVLMYRERMDRLRDLALPIAMAGVPTLLILAQPDLGTALVLPAILFVMLFAAGASKKNLAIILLVCASAAPPAYMFVLKDYQRARITAFLNPSAYSQRESYQLLQSIDAIGSGKLLGKGVGQGTQNLLDFVPAKHSDFIFSVMGEEWGFAGCCIFLLTYLALLWLCLGVGLRTREPFARLVAVGLSVIFAVQLTVNIGMTVGLMPITGLPLPFVSYGGSSLISSMIGIGVLLNISVRKVYVSKQEDEDHGARDYTWKYIPQPRVHNGIHSKVNSNSSP